MFTLFSVLTLLSLLRLSFATLIVHQPIPTTLTETDVLVYQHQIEGQDLLLFSFNLYTGCYLSKNFYYPDKNIQSKIRLIHHIPIRAHSVSCPCFYGTEDLSLDEFLNDVLSVAIKHNQFENFGLHFAILYGIIDYQNKTASSFAVVRVTNNIQKDYLSHFLNPDTGFLHPNLIRLFQIYQAVEII